MWAGGEGEEEEESRGKIGIKARIFNLIFLKYLPFSCCLVEQSIQLCWLAAQIISNWWNMILKFHVYGTNEKMSGALSLDQSWIKSKIIGVGDKMYN